MLNELEDAEEIFVTGTQILSVYKGIYTLLDRNRNMDNYFSLQELINVDNEQNISRNIKTEIYKIDLDFSVIEESEENQPTNSIYILYERIVKENFLTNLFFLLSNKVDYRMLYIIYDDIRYFLKKNADKDFLNPFSAQLNRFTHTANNYEVLGFYSRHGRTNHMPPQSPMSLEESKNLIFNIIAKLLNDKFGIVLPTYWGLSYIDYSDLDFKQFFDD